MEHPWLDFWSKFGETLGIAAAFCFGGAGFMLWVSPEEHGAKSGITVIMGGQILTAATTAFVHGYLGWSIFIAPIVGLGCGLIGSFVLLAVIKVGKTQAVDIVAAGVKRFTGKEPSA